MSVYKDTKHGTWYAKFNYKNWKGETKFTTKRGFATKREATQYENDFKMHISGNVDMNFKDFVELYREEHYPRIRVSTAATKDHIIETKLLPYFGKLKVTDIKSKDIIKWQNELLGYRDVDGKPYSQTYLKTIHNQMSAIMNFAVKYYDLSENPVAKAGSIGVKEAPEMQFWTLDEYTKFADVMMDEPVLYYCFEVLYWTGISMDLTLGQQTALDGFTKGENILLLGDPGTGKSTLISEMMNYAKMNDLNMAMTASTGIAAQMIGGRTIHSLLKA